MALSRLDLPKIRKAVSDLFRILESPTATNETACRVYLERWNAKSSTLGQQDPTGKTAAAFISAGISHVLLSICEHIGDKCPEITDSQLDLQTKAALLELREKLLPTFAAHRLTNDAGVRVRFLLFLEQVLARIAPPAETQAPTGSTTMSNAPSAGPAPAGDSLPQLLSDSTRVEPGSEEQRNQIYPPVPLAELRPELPAPPREKLEIAMAALLRALAESRFGGQSHLPADPNERCLDHAAWLAFAEEMGLDRVAAEWAVYHLVETGRLRVVWPQMDRRYSVASLQEQAARYRGGRTPAVTSWDLFECGRVLQLRSTPLLWEWYRRGCPDDSGVAETESGKPAQQSLPTLTHGGEVASADGRLAVLNRLAMTRVIDALVEILSRRTNETVANEPQQRYDLRRARLVGIPTWAEFAALIRRAREEAAAVPADHLPLSPGPALTSAETAYRELSAADPDPSAASTGNTAVNDLCTLRDAWMAIRCPEIAPEPVRPNAPPSSASPPPSEMQTAEGGPFIPEAGPDGPFDVDGFRFAGIDVRFGRAAKQRCLVMAMWDAVNARPASARPVEDVIAEVWGDGNETEDSTFRQLCADTRKRFQVANCPLDIRYMSGKVQLSPL